MKVASIAAAIILVVGIGLGGYSYASPYSYVDIDINPSVEITSNVFNRIIDIKALNKDGEKIIALGNYRNKSIDDGVTMIIKSALDNGYLKVGLDSNTANDESVDNSVMFTVSCKNSGEGEKIKKNLSNIVASELKTDKVKGNVISENATIQTHSNAKKIGISSGKMLLIEKLQKKDATAKTGDYKDAPVKDIVKAIDKAEKVVAQTDKSTNSKDKKRDTVVKQGKKSKSNSKSSSNSNNSGHNNNN